MMMMIMMMMIMIIIIIAFKVANRGGFFTISSQRREAYTYAQVATGAIVCKSRATHRELITCKMSCYVPRGTKGQVSC